MPTLALSGGWPSPFMPKTLTIFCLGWKDAQLEAQDHSRRPAGPAKQAPI